jgi:uncharacterized membrane protein HdeD (DUF308 family)
MEAIRPFSNESHTRRGWPVVMGIVLIILGATAVAVPVATSAALAWTLGVLFLASGIAQLIHAFNFIKHSGRVGRFLLSAISIVAGVLTLRNPFGGMMGITLALSFYMLINAVMKGAMAVELRPLRGWGWLVASSLISFIFGVYLLITLPISSLFVPGFFFGVDLIFFGVSMVVVPTMIRKIENEIYD